jgi:tRNA threonylcarbamoyladenosine biosynthesis protein TsaB
MVKIAHGKFERKEFENVAYFEPFYLKDFIGTPSKKTFIH